MANEESQSEIPVQVGGEEPPSSLELAFEKHKKIAVFAVVVIALAAFAYVIFEHRTKSANEAAAQAFTNAKTIDEFSAVSQEHQGTVAAGNALLMKADLQANDNKLNEAQATLTEFITNYTDHPRYLQGVLALGILAQQKNDLDEAERYFQQVIDEGESAEVAPLALIRKGDIAYTRGDYPVARSLYQSVEPTYPGSPFAFAARQKLNREKLTPPPPTAPVPTPAQAPAPVPAPKPQPKPNSPQDQPENQEQPGTPERKNGDAKPVPTPPASSP